MEMNLDNCVFFLRNNQMPSKFISNNTFSNRYFQNYYPYTSLSLDTVSGTIYLFEYFDI